MGSKRYKLNKEDLTKVARDALYIGTAAALAFVGSEVIPNLDADSVQNGTVIVSVAGVAIRFIQQWLSDNSVSE